MNAASFTFDDRTEDLLVRYFDGTLSEPETQEFTRLLSGSPTLQEELRRVQAFDTFLDNAHLLEQEEERVDTAFLLDMQRTFGSIVLAGAAISSGLASASSQAAPAAPNVQPAPTPTDSMENELANLNAPDVPPESNDDGGGWLQSTTQQGTSQTVTQTATGAVSEASVLSTATSVVSTAFVAKVVAGVVFVGVTAYSVWKYVVQPADDNLHFTEQTTTNPTPNTSTTTGHTESSRQDAPPTSTAPTNASANQQAASHSASHSHDNTAASSEAPNNNAPLKPAETVDGKLPDANTDASFEQSSHDEKTRKEIETYRQRLSDAEAQGDKASAAFAEKSLGVLLRDNGRMNEAAPLFDRALKTAQTLKLRELEADTYGELGKLYARQGQADRAVQSFQKAVEILSDLGKSTERWKREIQKVERK